MDSAANRRYPFAPPRNETGNVTTMVARRLGRMAGKLARKVKKEKSRDLLRIEEQLADRLAAAVEIRVHRTSRRGEQGEIAIAFASLDELNGLLEKLGTADA